MMVAVGKGIDRGHGAAQKPAQDRLPRTRAILAHGRQVVTSMADGGKVMWLGSRVVLFPAVSRVGVVGVRKRKHASRVLSDAELSLILSRGSSGRDGEQIDCGLGTGTACSVEDRPEEGGVGQNLSPSQLRNRCRSDNGLGYE